MNEPNINPKDDNSDTSSLLVTGLTQVSHEHIHLFFYIFGDKIPVKVVLKCVVTIIIIIPR